MGTKVSIFGFVKFINLSGGFWGIVDIEGKNWFPLNLPEHLKKEGLTLRIDAQRVEDFYSIQMWGTPIQINGFFVL